jgi:TonB family protein
VRVIGALIATVSVGHADPCDSTLKFEHGRAALTASTKQALEPLRTELRASPQLHVQIIAASDALAVRRAEAAKWYLVDGGVEVDRIQTSTAANGRDELHVQVVGGTCTAMAPAPKPAPGLVAPKDAGKDVPKDAGKSSMVDDASALASLLASDDSPKAVTVPHATPTSEHAPAPPAIHIGNDDVGFRGSDISMHVTTVPYELALARTLIKTSSHHEEQNVERTSLVDPSSETGEVVEGSGVKLDPKQVRPLARCYRRALGMDPTISNRVNLSFGIDKKGHVTAAVAISDTDQLDTCLSAAMKKWQFAPGKPMAGAWMTITLHAR